MSKALSNELFPRPIRPTERAAVEALGVDLFAPFGDYRGVLRGWLRSPGVSCLVVKTPGEALTGFSLVGVLPTPNGTLQAYLLGIGVQTKQQRSGCGQILLKAALNDVAKRASRWGVSEIHLEVAEDNLAALQLFAQAGFQIQDRVNTPRYTNGPSALRMVLPLTPIQEQAS